MLGGGGSSVGVLDCRKTGETGWKTISAAEVEKAELQDRIFRKLSSVPQTSMHRILRGRTAKRG